MNGWDETLRQVYPLTPESVVLDLGAYHGIWSKIIWDRYRSKIYAYEPVSEFYRIATETLRGTEVCLQQVGVAAVDAVMDIRVQGDRSTLFMSGGITESVRVKAISTVMDELPHAEVDLIKLNIEGSEYNVLESCLNNGLVKRFQNIQVQFHAFMPNAQQRRDDIRKALSATHRVTYDYPFIWENWERR